MTTTRLARITGLDSRPVSRGRSLVGFLATVAIWILAAAHASGCKALPPNLVPSDCQAWKIALEQLPAGQVRDEAQAAFAAKYPQGCPVAPPTTTPPVAEPPSNPPTPPPDIPPAPPAPPAGCVLSGAPRFAVLGYENTLGPLVNSVMVALHPTHCSSGRCVLNLTRQEWQDQVNAALRSPTPPAGWKSPKPGEAWRPVCSGQHGKDTDEIAVAEDRTKPMQGFHVYAATPDDHIGTIFFSTCPEPGADGVRKPCLERQGSSYRGAWLPPGAPAEPPAEPTPSPTTPTASACGSPRWEDYRVPTDAASCTLVWAFSDKPAKWRDANGDLVWGKDATLNVQRCCGFCKAINMGEYNGHIRCQCPLRPEGHPERDACEAEVGALWKSDGTMFVNPANRAQATCAGCTWEQVCTKDLSCSSRVAP